MKKVDTKTKIKRLKTQCDELWSKCVRLRDGKCALCGKTENLNAHHWVHSKAQGNLHRWDVRNGLALCYADHIYKVHTYASADITERLKTFAFDTGVITPADYDAMYNDHTIMKDSVEQMESVKTYLTTYLEQLEGR